MEPPVRTIESVMNMSKMKCLSAAILMALASQFPAFAQSELRPVDRIGSPNSARPAPSPEAPPLSGANSAGGLRMKSLLDAISDEDYSQMPEETRRAIETGVKSSKFRADMNNLPASVLESAAEKSTIWEKMSREAYVAGLPPRDQPRGSRLLLGDGGLPGNDGTLYIFVSRSMPMSLLRAYALDALYTGASLVVKGVRKGDTIKEYVQEALNDFNSVDGQSLAGIEVNPNLFDMFDVSVVPAVVWTNRVGLEDIGSGCGNLPEGEPLPQMVMDGPDDTKITVNKPVCAKVPSSAYYKLTGTIALPYVFERFEEAGLSKEATQRYKDALAERHSNVHDSAQQDSLGRAQTPMSESIKLDLLPRPLLKMWQEQLATRNVQRSPYGPVFSNEEEDDPMYRQELKDRIDHGLGL